MSKQWAVMGVVALLGIIAAMLFVVLQENESSYSTELTELHGAEMTDVLNHYFAILQTEAAFQDPVRYCKEVAIDNEEHRCIVTQGARTFHDTNEVVRLQVLEYQPKCAVVMAVFTAVGTTTTDAFLLWKVEDAWKVAARDYAVGEFNKAIPAISVTCGE
jgi:hypothetical protein